MAAAPKKKKKTIKPIAKPYLKGPVFCPMLVKRALKLLVYPLIFILINLFVGAVFSFEGSPFLRYLMNGLLIAMTVALLYTNGQSAGYADVSIAEIMYTHQQEGKPVSPAERERCFHPLRGCVTAALAYLPVFILALISALTVQRQTMSLTPLPGWVSSFSYERDFMVPLQYYQETGPVMPSHLLSILMRLMTMPYINLVGARNWDLALLMDRLAPLTLSLPYIGYAIGYLRGRYSRAMMHGSVAAARRKRSRPAKKKTTRRTKGPEELV